METHTETAFPAMRIMDAVAEALEYLQKAPCVTIAIADSQNPKNLREFRVEGSEIIQMAHALRRTVAREEAS